METHDIARSLKGHAANAGVDKWVMIQENTFRNWVNEQLRSGGMEVENLENDFDSGVLLCGLISALQGKRIRVIKSPKNQHQQLANVSEALAAIAHDNIKLVNIGPEDIVNGNLKLILGLIWHLILRYQIGKSKFPTKKLMLAWLNAVVPNRDITNFTSDWNDGIALHAVIDWCRPGLCPNWKNLSRSDGLNNCRSAMMLAKQHFDIPLVVRPEDLSSSDLDELSGMTYLSYFMKLDSPGYHATLNLARRLLRQQASVNNFTTDWSDGRLLCKLVNAVGGNVAGFPSMSADPVENMQNGLTAAQSLGIDPILTAKQMCDPEIDHIGIMAYVVYFQSFKPVRSSSEKVIFTGLPSNCSVGQEAYFTINLEDDDVSAGDIRAEVTGPESKHTVHFNWEERSGTGYFTPTETGLHRLNVYCENEMINGCPASFKVLADRSKVTFNAVDSCSLGTPTELAVNCAAAGEGEVHMEARSPTGRLMRLTPIPRHGGKYVSTFDPTEVGEWEVSVKYDGEHISESPYTINVYDPSAVRIYNLESGLVGSALTFNADSTRAGHGNLRVTVENNGRTVQSQVYEETNGVFKINFTPEGPGTYNVNVFFNETEVRGSPYQVDVGDSSNVTVSGDGINLVPVNRTASFEVNPHGQMSGKVNVEILSPNGTSLPVRIQKESNEFIVEYTPTEVGDHKIEVKYADHEVAGSPFVAKAYNTGAILVTDLPNGVVGQPIEFGIDVRSAGEGQLEIMVNNGNLPNTVESEETGVYRMSFIPEVAGTQTVEIIFNKESHPDSPFQCIAVDLNKASVRSFELQLPVDREASFYVSSENISSDINASVDITSPSGDSVHASVYRQGSGEFKVEWTPRVAGRHRVDVQFGGSQIDGSPFFVDVFDLATIRVDNFRNGIVGEDAGFSVDFSNAGTLDQEVQVINPSGHDVVLNNRELGYLWKDYTYEPEEPGTYKIFIRYGGFQLPGCPFTQEVKDGGLPTASGPGLYFGEEDKPAHFDIDVGRRRGDLRVVVSGPNSMAKCSVEEKPGGVYAVTYIPVETGLFDVNVSWNGTDIPGSPYHPKVVDARKVKIIGGWQHFMDGNERVNLVVGERKQLPFDVSEAGPGTLRADVKGPTRSIDVDIDTHVMGRATVEFIPEEEGNHYIHLFWSDVPLANSPFLGYAVRAHADPSKLILTGRGLKEAVVREEAEFLIDGSQAGKGTPEVILSGVRAEVNVKTVPIGNGKFKCSYIPMVPGAYLLHITWNGRQLRGSPYKVNVIGAFYPNKVIVSGEGLKGGNLGRKMDVRIDTRKAGPGELTAYCMGPHQVAYCELEDNRDGTFQLGIKAQEPGRHVLQVKYSGEHVQGSPFIFKVTSQPDASKVRVTGPGVEHGILATYISRFTVETRGAGSGQLTVRIRGPKGGFQVEMYRDSQRDRTILCRYDPRECGLYIVSIKWSGVDVPGSPFKVNIFDTQEELEQALTDTSYSIGTVNSGPPNSYRSVNGQEPPRLSYSKWRDNM